LSTPEPRTEFAALPIEIGDLVDRKYKIERLLGEGGMACVYRALHTQLDDYVALKFLRPEAALRADIKARFRDEARAAGRLRSPHVARVRDVGEHVGLSYLVLDYLAGRDLRDALSDGFVLPVQRAADYIIQACEGVAEAHAAGIVHRDLKPENLFIEYIDAETEIIKVLDFGISKVNISGALSEIALQGGTREIIGSPLYMAPEQIRTPHDIDGRVDVWSLGVVLFEMLTLQHPFGRVTAYPTLVARVLETPAALASMHNPLVPSELEAVVQKALAKSPAVRFATVVELATALAPFASKSSRAVAEEVARRATMRGWHSLPDTQLPSTPPSSPSLAPPSSHTLAHGSPPAASVAPPQAIELAVVAVAAEREAEVAAAVASEVLPPAPASSEPLLPSVHLAQSGSAVSHTFHPPPEAKQPTQRRRLARPIGIAALLLCATGVGYMLRRLSEPVPPGSAAVVNISSAPQTAFVSPLPLAAQSASTPLPSAVPSAAVAATVHPVLAASTAAPVLMPALGAGARLAAPTAATAAISASAAPSTFDLRLNR
jgi:eukaryotic-like serine/threonine-protein kinase